MQKRRKFEPEAELRDGYARFCVESSNKKLRRRILVCSSFLAIVIGAVVTFVVEEQRRTALTRAETHAANLSVAFEELIKRTLDTINGATDVLAKRIAVEGRAFDLASWATSIPELAAPISQVIITDPDGIVLTTTLRMPSNPVNLSDRESFRVLRDDPNPGLFIGKPVLGRISNKLTIPIAKRLVTVDGAFAGIIIFSLAPEFLTSLHKKIDLGQTGSITLVGEDGVVRAGFTSISSRDASTAIGAAFPDVKMLQGPGNANTGGYTGVNSIDGMTRLFQWRKVAVYPLFVVVGLGREEILRPVNEQNAVIAGLGGSAIMLTITLAAMLTHEISRRSAYGTALLEKSEKLRYANDCLTQEHRALQAMSAALASERCSLRAANAGLKSAMLKAEAATAAKSAFLANMSHELRTPLNAIIGFSEIIRDQFFGGAPERYASYAANIHASGMHLLKIIGDVLDLAKIEARKIELAEQVVDLKSLMLESIEAVRLQADMKEISMPVIFPENPVSLLCDETRFKQIMLNLLSNAVKFTPPSGEIAISASFEKDGSVTISIADSGIGMSPSEIECAFETFRQIDNSLSKRYEGTGLGLPIARELTSLHGGTLSLESVPSKGTTASVTIPASRVVLDLAPEQIAA